MEIINPATGDQIGSIKPDNAESLQQKYKQLQAGQVKWLQIPVSERIAIITRYAGLLEASIEELALTLTSEVGKPLNQSRNEINGSRNRIKWMTSNAEKYLTDETMYADESITEIIRYEPLGVICNISAWNYPYLVGTNVFIPALLAGNAVCYKPSEYATLTGLHIERLLKQAGVPDDVFQVATGDAAVGELLLDMNFNASINTGNEVLRVRLVLCLRPLN